MLAIDKSNTYFCFYLVEISVCYEACVPSALAASKIVNPKKGNGVDIGLT